MNSIFLFLNISGGEILVILVVVYLVFGPKKIPELARMLGKGINELRRATNEIKNEITKETSGIKKDIGVADLDLNDPLDLNKPTKKKSPSAQSNKSQPHKKSTVSEKANNKSEEKKTEPIDTDPYNLKGEEPIDR